MNRKSTRGSFVSAWVLVFAVSLAQGQTPSSRPFDAARKKAIVGEISSLLRANYIFLETAQKIGETLQSRLEGGAFDDFKEPAPFARAVSAILAEVGRDKHMGFAFNPAAAEDFRRLQSRSEEDARKVRERQLQEDRDENFGFRKVERLDGNVGYLDFRYFDDPALARETAVAAMNFLAYCDAIIVDLRRNGGGQPAMIQLISSYFFTERTHLNDLYTRATDSTQEFWTLPDVPGPKPVDADLYILTSSRSFSGAEEFTYNMKNLKRATVIGETTGGGAHPTRGMIVDSEFILRVPFARAINPISKTNWEGTGVEPDIAVPAAEAFDRAYVLALENLAAKAADPDRKLKYKAILAGIKKH